MARRSKLINRTMSIGDLIIPSARPSDASILLPLINASVEGISAHLWAQIAKPDQDPWDIGRARVCSEDSAISYRKTWIAEIESAIAGCLILNQLPDSPVSYDADLPPILIPLHELENAVPGTCLVYVLSTVKEMRGLGIGTRLLHFADTHRGPKGMSLIVADNNFGAKKLYERCGYVEVARRRIVKGDWQSSGRDSILMAKT